MCQSRSRTARRRRRQDTDDRRSRRIERCPCSQVRGLEKWYGRRQVVNGVDYDVEQGEVVGLLGPNGAGKTTSFRMTIGLIDADGGKVIFDGRDVTRLPMYLRAQAGMGYLAQDSSVFRQLSVEDNLMAILETRKDLTRKQRTDRQNELLDQFGLTKIRKTKANRVSGGERRRLEIARSLITEPKMIMLDEPFAGIDPKTVAEIQDQIRDLAERYNMGILLTDHQFRETLEVTDRCYLIREGRVFAYGNREQILKNPDVRRHYIGERFDVGHLLDRRRPVSISHHSSPPADSEAPAAVAAPAPVSVSVSVSAPFAGPMPFTAPAQGFETEEYDADGTSVLLGSYVTTELILGDIERISVQSTIGTNAANLPPAPHRPTSPCRACMKSRVAESAGIGIQVGELRDWAEWSRPVLDRDDLVLVATWWFVGNGSTTSFRRRSLWTPRIPPSLRTNWNAELTRSRSWARFRHLSAHGPVDPERSARWRGDGPPGDGPSRPSSSSTFPRWSCGPCRIAPSRRSSSPRTATTSCRWGCGNGGRSSPPTRSATR